MIQSLVNVKKLVQSIKNKTSTSGTILISSKILIDLLNRVELADLLKSKDDIINVFLTELEDDIFLQDLSDHFLKKEKEE